MAFVLAAVAAFQLSAMAVAPAEPFIRAFDRTLEVESVWSGCDDEYRERQAQVDLDNAELRRIRKGGFSALRVKVDLWYFADAQTGAFKPEPTADFVSFVERANANGLATLIVLDRANIETDFYGRSQNQLMDDPKVGREMVRKFWGRLAEALREVDLERNAFEPLALWEEEPTERADLDFAQTIRRTIQRATPGRWVFLPHAAVSGSDPHTVGTFRFEGPAYFTRQGTGDLEELNGMPWPPTEKALAKWVEEGRVDDDLRAKLEAFVGAGWGRKKLDELIKPVCEWRGRCGLPVFCSQFGIARDVADDDNRTRYLRDVRESLEARGIGWSINRGPVFTPDGTIVFSSKLMDALGLKEPDDVRGQLTP